MSVALKIEMFGAMRIWVDGEPFPRVRSRKAKWLLALLALRGGGPIGRGLAAGMLWPDADATIALTNLRSVVSDLRRALGDQEERLRTPDRKTLSFDLSGAEVDVSAFDRAVRIDDRERVVALYTGPLLEDCDEEWILQDRAARERACLKALKALAEEADPAGAVAWFQRAVEIAPWNEAARRDLMTGLANAGDVNAALAAYRDFAQSLRGETGGSPDLQTTELYVRLRSGEGVSNESAPPNGTTATGSLPSAVTSFIGREDELLDLGLNLRRHRLVTLVGIGGNGKTRLAREVAQSTSGEFSDGGWFLPLDAVHDDEGVLRQAATVLKIKESAGKPLLDKLIAGLRSKRLLLILDNCEHLLAACARFSTALLEQCPDLKILATSREPLGLIGEKVWPVPALTVPDPKHLPDHAATRRKVLMGYEAVQLFVERAKEASAAFELTQENSATIAELCGMLDGSPLALELAACRTRTMSVSEIVTRLRQHRLDLLTGGRYLDNTRHQTLRAALDWSYSLLREEERILFARLSVFSGGWTLEAAERVAGASPDDLESLVDKSMVTFSGERYSFLETLRQYASEKLTVSGERPAMIAAHRDWAVQLAEQFRAQGKSPEPFERELDNFRAALDSEGDPEATLRLSGALGVMWELLCARDEGIRRIDVALEHPAVQQATGARARAFLALGSLLFRMDSPRACRNYRQALDNYRAVGDQIGASKALGGMGLSTYFEGKFDEAISYWEEALAAARNADDKVAEGIALASIALGCFPKGEFGRARELVEESLAIFRPANERYHIAETLRDVSVLAHYFGDYEAMRASNEEALALFRDLGRDEGVASCLEDLGKAATDLGQYGLAEELLESSLRVNRKIENGLGVAASLSSMGDLALARGDIEGSKAHQNQSLEGFRSVDHRLGIARALDGLGDAFATEGQPEKALRYHREALTIWREVGDRKRIRDAFVRLGDDVEDSELARRLWRRADLMGEEMGIPIPILLRNRHETRKQAHGEGQTPFDLPLDEAIDLALGI